MTLHLGPGEQAAGPWRVETVEALVGLLWERAGDPVGRPRIVGVDGRSAGGKTTTAGLVAAHVPGAVVVHTDDVAWHHGFFDWADLLRAGILDPLHRGEAVHYRPPGWVRKDRAGAIDAAAGSPLVVVEGVGAARRETRALLDAVVWVQSDLVEARRRGLVRDGGDPAAVAFWDEWAAEEEPFLADQRPWEHADVIVAGTPSLDHDPATQVVLAPPLRRREDDLRR